MNTQDDRACPRYEISYKQQVDDYDYDYDDTTVSEYLTTTTPSPVVACITNPNPNKIGTGDTFLGTNDLTPASADCSHLIVKIHFPGCTMGQLDLDVTKERIKAESKTLR